MSLKHGRMAPPSAVDSIFDTLRQRQKEVRKTSIEEEVDSDWDSIKATARKQFNYEKIAEAIMDELVANELEDLLIVKNLEVGKWWADVMTERARIAEITRQKEEAVRKKEEDLRAKEALLGRLTAEEKRLLGL